MSSRVTLDHGEIYGKLTVLERVDTDKGPKYRVGCQCGYSGMLVRKNALMRGRVKSCVKCRETIPGR